MADRGAAVALGEGRRVMGLGGHLLWTSVIRTLNEASGRPVRVCHAPLFSDLAAGRLHRGDLSLADDPVFEGNPRIEFPDLVRKGRTARLVDRLGAAAVRRLGLTAAYESTVLGLARRRARAGGILTAHIDLRRHSYVAHEAPDRVVWKPGGHIIDIILRNFGMRARDHRCEMYFSNEEEQQVTEFCREHGLVDGFVVIEPNSKDTWFGDLRAWPFERWQVVVDHLVDRRRQVVQVGDGTGRALERVIHLAGELPVRLSVCLMKRARLFLGLEGGLMHAANAADVPAVIVWGGLTEPTFAAYPERHHVICKHVECAPCGLRGGCPYEKKCLTSIGVDEVVQAVDRTLAGGRTRADGPPS